MTRALSRLGLLALIPAALNLSAPAGASMAMPICTGDGQVRMVQVPLDNPAAPGDRPEQCCAKGCHGGPSRKKPNGQFDPPQ